MTDPRTTSDLIGVSAAADHHRDVVARRALLAGVVSFVITSVALMGGFVLVDDAASSLWSAVGVINLLAIAIGVAGLRGSRWEETRDSRRAARNTAAAIAGLACASISLIAILVARAGV
jgi:amino acid transporter